MTNGKDKEYQAEEHRWTLEEISAKYSVSLDYKEAKRSLGIGNDEALVRLGREGKNQLTPPKKTPEIIKFLSHFINPFMILLEVAAILCAVAFALQAKSGDPDKSNLYLSIVLFVIVIGTCIMSYLQERKSGALMDSFKNLLPPKCMVIRNGVQQKVFSEDLVLGDLVFLSSGDKTPADLRIIHCQDLKVDNSSLTGESEPQSRNAEISKEDNPIESSNLAFYGTLAVDGSALGVVIRRGDDTLLGQIAGLTKDKGGSTTLELEVKRFVLFISALAVFSGIIFFGVGLYLALKKGGGFSSKEENIITQLINTIGIIVANVPEGLPATVTICLTIAARRLAKNKVWVKELESVETLGSTTMICSDKTGTLTQNRMTAVHSWYNGEIHDIKPIVGEYMRTHNPAMDIDDQTSARLMRVASICSRAQFEQIAIKLDETSKPLIERDIIGDASETALLRMCESYFDTIPFREHFSKIFEIPFNSTNKFQLSIHALPDSDVPFVTQGRRGLRRSIMGLPTIDNGISVGGYGTIQQDNYSSASEDEGETTSLLRSSMDESQESNPYDNFASMEREQKIVKSKRRRRIKQFSESYHKKEAEDMVKNFPIAKALNQRLVAIKGAPEIIVSKCDSIMIDGRILPFDEEWQEKFQETITTLASGGERILGFAQLQFEDHTDPSQYNIDAKNYPLSGFTFLGLISLMDPPRPSVPQSIQLCRTAGIKVAMVTGDHPLTAKAIAKQIGLLSFPTKEEIAAKRGVPISQVSDSESKSVVITGTQLREWNEDDWAKILDKKEFVFARTSPQQKLVIVEHFQQNGEVVAVTGDGVNDSPALKQANIGVAMGIAGSDVAKEAANIILMDDNFSSITKGVEEGRVIFDNLSKSIMYTLSHLLPEVVPFILNMSSEFPVALTTILILLVDLGTELAPAISLAYERPEANIMKKRPRNIKKDRLVSFQNLFYAYIQLGIIETIAGFACFLWVFHEYGLDPRAVWDNRSSLSNGVAFDYQDHHFDTGLQSIIMRKAQTSYFIAMVLCQIANLIACKTRMVSVFRHGFRNNWVNASIPISSALMAAIVFIPPFNGFIGSLPPPPLTWVVPLPFMLFIVVHTEIIKAIKRKLHARRKARREKRENVSV
eukprot:TRINITY_DN3765_c0_g1_i1.p1 TRINITY_DN3765_c0_g1~~TRINITY_DN3765_c0_g1_i1.p1  ORF type:complete len:1126 (-),score=460.97 TRINITY_DN3765_c0_g1_i1:37-3414(-)